MTIKSKTQQGSPSPVQQTLSAAQRSEFNELLNSLTAQKSTWANLPIADRILILDEIKALLPSIEKEWVAAGMQVTEGQPGSLVEAEEWFTLSVIYRLLHFLRRSLLQIERGLDPFPVKRLKPVNDQYKSARVIPQSLFDRLAFPGISAEVWLDEESTSQASAYRQSSNAGSLCLVLAAGNVASLVPGDFMHKLFVEQQVVLVKSNPVNENLIPLLQRAFEPLIRRGFLQIVPGDKSEGGFLANHPLVDELHITGSDRSFESIVFGPGFEGQRRKSNQEPLISKRFTAELGNISPVIIVPGPWSESDLAYQARKIGSWLTPNAGHNCLTPRVLINHSSWSQRAKLLSSISEFLDQNPTRKAYYPGSKKIHADFIAAHPDAQQLGQQQDGHLPWTFIPGLDPASREDICFNREAFIGLFSETALEAESIPQFIERAVEFANDRLWGTLSATIIVHPTSMRDPAIAQALEDAIAQLDYGSVIVNHWGALAYYLISSPWGGAPGRDIYDIQSGVDWVNNPFMFDQPQKSVIRAPFRQIPDPYMADTRDGLSYFKRDTRFQANPSLPNLIRLLWAAIRS